MRLFLGCILAAALALLPTAPRANAAASDDSPAKKAADSSSNSASEATAKPDASAEPAKSSLESEIEELRDLLLTQSQQLQAQSDQLKQQQEKMQMLEEQLKTSGVTPVKLTAAPAAQPVAASAPGNPAIPAAAPASASIPAASAAAPAPSPAQQPQKAETAAPSPLSFNIGSAKFTPSGFMDLTNFFRTKDIGSGIGTTFSSVPYNNALPLGSLTEDHFSIQNSRIALRVDSTVAGGAAIGYVEADFLGFTNDNLNVTSNSNTLRSRLYFIDYRRGKWEILGGQDWSMVTPSRTGIAVMPGDVFNTQDMDTNYNVGLSWERTAQFRFIVHPSNKVALGFGIENPQQYTGNAVTLPTSPIAFNATQLNIGTSLNSTALGAASGSVAAATNSLATPDVAPDLIAKIAIDPNPAGHAIHLEAYGLFRTFKINTTSGTTNLGNTTIHGGAVSFNSNFEIFKNFKIYETAFYSSGGGREIGNSNVPDFIVVPAPNAASRLGLSPVHADAGILGFEYQTTPKFMVYGYYGYVYVGRNYSLTGCGATGTGFCGYGFPGSSNSNNRSIDEPTIGFIPTFWRNPNYGALSLITQFSYLSRSPWIVAAGAPRNAHAGMAYIDLRYTLP
jgi:TolA-binding protein